MSWDEGELRAEIASDFAEYSGAWGSARHVDACARYQSARLARLRAAWARYYANRKLDAEFVARRRERQIAYEASERGAALKRAREARRVRIGEGARRIEGVCGVCGARFVRTTTTRGDGGDGCSTAHTRAIRAGTPVVAWRGMRDTTDGHARRAGLSRGAVRWYLSRSMSAADALEHVATRGGIIP